MFDIEIYLDKYIYSRFKNSNIKTFVLNGFYDISVNDNLYFSVNMLSIEDNNLHIYRMSTRIFSIELQEITHFLINYHYRKLNFKIIPHF